uniref:SDR family NAD(P)-dependent oxidoreductase n=1 Tax=Roseovarius indicus TaxID=540747 RepID=UPI003B51DB11
MTQHHALVTGATSGLGLAIARALAASGAAVTLTGILSQEDGDAVATSLAEETGSTVTYDPADLRSRSETETLVDRASARAPVDIVVNNAVLRHFKPVEDCDPDEWDASLAVNLTAAFNFSRLCVPAMKRQGWGRILNVASIYGTKGAANRIDYVTTKAGLIGMTRALALELAQTGITCNAISPGTVLSEPIEDRIAGQARDAGITLDEAKQTYLATRNPNGRFIDLAAVGAAATFLCSDAAADINGADLPIDGGWSVA